MRTRSLAGTGVAAAATLAAFVALSGQASARSGHDLHFYAEYVRIESLDLGAAGTGFGDQLVYHDRAFDSPKKARKLADGFGNCVRQTGDSDSTGLFHCTETVRLKGGDVLIGGIYDLAAKTDVWTIAGGTGRYRDSTGVVSFSPLSATTLDGAFHFDR